MAGSGRTPYLGGATTKKAGSSFGHFVGRVGKLIADTPAGVVTYGLAASNALFATPAKIDVALGWASEDEKKRAHSGISDFINLNKAIIGSTATTVRHPARDPAQTALLVPSLLMGGRGLVARAGTATAIAGRGGTVGEIAGALTRPAPTTARIVHLDGEPVEIGAYSRGAAKRDIQKGLDKIREQYPDVPIAGRSLRAKVGFEGARSRHYEEVIARVPGLELLHAQRKLSLPEHTALRVVAEGIPIATRLKVHTADLAKATDRNTQILIKRQIRLLNKAKPLVETRVTFDAAGKRTSGLKLTNPKLQSVYDTLKSTAKSREDLLDAFDLLGPGAAARVHAPGRVFLGAQHVPETPGRIGKPSQALIRQRSYVERLEGLYDRAVTRRDKAAAAMIGRAEAKGVTPPALRIGGKVHSGPSVLTPPHGARVEHLGAALSEAKTRLIQMEEAAARRVEPTGLIGAEDFTGGQVYVGYGSKRPSTGLVQVGNRVIGVPRRPGSLSKGFTGGAVHAATFRTEAAQVVAHAQFEAARYTMLLRIRPQLERFATLTKVRPGQVALRLDKIDGDESTTQAAKVLMQEALEGKPLNELETQGLGASYEAMRNIIFPTEAEAARIPGVVWIDEKLLGGMNKPNPATAIMAHPAGKVFIGGLDIINNVSRFAILYLKPAYLIPNLLGNFALNIIQQGFAAPVNLGRAARINAELTGKAVSTMDALIGEGAARAIAAQGGPLAELSQAWSSQIGRIVDVVPRRASFLHEAARAGYRSTREVEELLTNPARREDLVRVSREANSEMVDFNRLGLFERDFVRRVIFFYPWVKGSTVYGARMLGEHPGMFAAMAAAGKLGETVTQGLGDVPSYAQGIFPSGGERSPGVPMVIQPQAASLLGSPAQVAQTVAGLFQGDVPSSFQTIGSTTPAISSLAALATGINSFGENPRGQSNFGTALEELYGVPQVTLAQRLRDPPSKHPGRVYPYTTQDAWLQFLIGGIAPRPYNKVAGQKKAKEGK
jgi:hypothetical protein